MAPFFFFGFSSPLFCSVSGQSARRLAGRMVQGKTGGPESYRAARFVGVLFEPSWHAPANCFFFFLWMTSTTDAASWSKRLDNTPLYKLKPFSICQKKKSSTAARGSARGSHDILGAGALVAWFSARFSGCIGIDGQVKDRSAPRFRCMCV
jgi:hypothetical protein